MKKNTASPELLAKLSGYIFEPHPTRFNTVCTKIAGITAFGLLVMGALAEIGR